MLDKAGSLEEFGAMLDAAFPKMADKQLVVDMAEGFAAAQLAGMAEVGGEARGDAGK